MNSRLSIAVSVGVLSLLALTACAPSGSSADAVNLKACKQLAGIQSQYKIDTATMGDDEIPARTLDELKDYQKVAVATPTDFGTSLSNHVTARRMALASGTPDPGSASDGAQVMNSVCSKLGVDLP